MYTESTSHKYAQSEKVWAACGGLKVLIQTSSYDTIQNMFYNGWTHSHYVGCIFVFAMDGRIRICSINAPGAWNDSTQADNGGVYVKIEQEFNETGAKAVIDLAFKLGAN